MKKILLFLLPLLAAISTFAQEETGSLEGYITTSDGKPAPFVTIAIKGLKRNTITDADGFFSLKQMKPGSYILQISFVGHSVQQQEAAVVRGETARVAIQLKTSDVELREVIVSGNRKSYIAEKPSASLRLNAPLIEIPQNITVATKQTLTDMGMLSKGEIFRLSSGITRSYGGYLDMTVQIRGTNATYGTYRNGIGGPIWWNAQEDAAMIERMEFVKGPAGFMLSNSEPGGLINTVTKQPTHQRIAEVGFGVGSWNLMRTNIDLGGEFKKDGKLTFRLNTGVQKNNEYYQFGGLNRVFVAPALKYEFNENTSLTLEHNYVKATAQENTHSSISINGDMWALPIDFAINDPNNKKWNAWDAYTRVALRHRFNDDWNFTAQAGYMTTDWSGTTLYLSGLSPEKDTLYRALSSNDWWGDLTNVQLFLDGKFNTGRNMGHKVLIGIDYGDGGEGSTYGGTWDEEYKYLYALSIANPEYYLPKDTLTYKGEKYSWMGRNKWQALYVQDHLKLFNKLILTLAGRYTRLTVGQDWNSPPDDPEYEITESKFTPRLGLTWLFSDNISAYMLHDESFLSQRGAIWGGGRLPPLVGRNNEVGVKALFFNKQLAATASAFDIIKNDVGNSDPLHDGFYLKTGQVRARGMEVDLAGKFNENIYVNVNYSYVDAKITKDKNPDVIGIQNNGTAKNLLNGWVKYQFSEGLLKGLGFGAGIQFTDKRSGIWPGWNDTDGNKYLPAYTVYDAALSYNIGRFSVGLNMYNLANKRYATSGSWEPDLKEWFFDIEQPRHFRLQTTVKL